MQSAGGRWKLLLDYFCEAEGFDGCGACDNCVTPSKRGSARLHEVAVLPYGALLAFIHDDAQEHISVD